MDSHIFLKMKACFVLMALIAVAAAQSGFGRRRSRESSSESNERRRFLQFSLGGLTQLPRGRMVCSADARFTVQIDGTTTTARCTDAAADMSTRCPGCCESVALAAGLTTDLAGAFPSNNGRSCICCLRSN
ncbi:hypothetical protein GCK72_010987 [Caenorhabditis remanei]|uniref:Uncharacterized protein n=2 Tax=Caenorhabditis remanei TaxID=31234 RepID=A0A6A5H6K5_CAERE|nr:hypothetical protein GCK72_010987 [Caenorhabditis remanei]KAF1762725.1 hypothetical protein GCK72_010987 [Caenorhabditis remanei]